jgi:drug/metabolite transporter (DMT)-like permease
VPLGWTALEWPVLAAICVVGVLAALGFACLNSAVRFAPVVVIAPFQYMALVWAAVFGFLVFEDVPTTATVVGGIAVVSSGLIIW